MSKKKETEEAFRRRIILVMADEMKAMKENVERSCVMFATLAASIGVSVSF